MITAAFGFTPDNPAGAQESGLLSSKRLCSGYLRTIRFNQQRITRLEEDFDTGRGRTRHPV